MGAIRSYGVRALKRSRTGSFTSYINRQTVEVRLRREKQENVPKMNAQKVLFDLEFRLGDFGVEPTIPIESKDFF